MKKMFLFVLVVCITLVLSSCGLFGGAEDDPVVTKIDIPEGQLADGYQPGAFDIADLQMIVTFSDGSTTTLPVAESMVSDGDRMKLLEPGVHAIVVTYEGVSASVIITILDLDDPLAQKLRAIYDLAIESEAFDGTYEEWLDSIRGPRGEDGREVTLRVAENHIQWRYVGEAAWTNLIALDSLIGPQGERGDDGQEVLIRVTDTHIQWKHTGDATWQDLIALDFLVGHVLPHTLERVEINEDGEVVLVFTDGTVLNTELLHERYLVVFRDHEDNIIDVQLVYKGFDATAPVLAVRKGHTFDGWSEDFTNVSAELDIHPLHTVNVHVLAFDTYGDLHDDVPAISVPYGASIELPNPTPREGKVFLGWHFIGADEPITELTMPDRDVVLEGRWEAEHYWFAAQNLNYDLFVEIQAGASHTVGITNDNHVLSWGDNAHGQLGIGMSESPLGPQDITDHFQLHKDERFIQLATSGHHTLVLTSVGRVFAWGSNAYGQIGMGAYGEDHTCPTPIDITATFELKTYERIALIAAGDHHSFAVSNMGRVFAWGANDHGQLGMGEVFEDQPIPVDITARFSLNHVFGETVVLLEGGTRHSVAVTSFGRVFTWGDNSLGQLGTSTSTSYPVPFDITAQFDFASGETVRRVAAKNHTMLLTNRSRLFTWGSNEFGQVGHGPVGENRHTPMEVTESFLLRKGWDHQEHITDIAAGRHHSLAIVLTIPNDRIHEDNISVFGWGRNHVGQLGSGMTDDAHAPINIYVHRHTHTRLMAFEHSVQIVAGDDHSVLLQRADPFLKPENIPVCVLGLPYLWGDNADGQLGIDYEPFTHVPLQLVSYGYRVVHHGKYSYQSHISFFDSVHFSHPPRIGHVHGEWHTDLTFSDPFRSRHMPGHNLTIYLQQVPKTHDIVYHALTPIDVVRLDAGGSMFLTTSDGRYFAWPFSWFDDPHARVLPYPTEIGSYFDLLPDEAIRSFSVGHGTNYALTTMNRVLVWGYHALEILGDEYDGNMPTHDVTARFGLDGDEHILDIVTGPHDPLSVALTTAGRVFTWGYSEQGMLGDGESTVQWTPIDITDQFDFNADERAQDVAIGKRHIVLLTTDNRVFSWGSNDHGALGDGTDVDRHSPVDITDHIPLVEGETMVTVQADTAASTILTSTGRVFFWGMSLPGTCPEHSPHWKLPHDITDQFALAEHETITLIAAGGRQRVAVTSYGRIFTWGYLLDDHIKDPPWDRLPSEPIDITEHIPMLGNDTVVDILFGGDGGVFLITDRGRIVTWGENHFGQLGRGFRSTWEAPSEWEGVGWGVVHKENHAFGEAIEPWTLDKPYYAFDEWHHFNEYAHTPYVEGLKFYPSGYVFFTMPNHVVNLFAKGEIERFTLTFLGEDSLVLFSESMHYDRVLENHIPIPPEVVGHAFVGWDETVPTRMPAEDLTFTAIYEVQSYTITFETYTDETIDPITALYGTPIDEPIPTNPDYLFGGWYTDEAFDVRYVFDTMGGEDITLYARWVPMENDILYMDYGPLHVKDIQQQGDFTLLLTECGRLFGWGSNELGQIAHVSEDDTILVPMDLTGYFDLGEETIIQISAGFSSGYALTDAGTLFSWGSNINGRLGVGYESIDPIPNPTDITANFGLQEGDIIIDIEAGNAHVFVRTQHGKVYAFGANFNGILGDGTSTQRPSPIDITDQFSDTIASISAGRRHTVALTVGGDVYAWGDNFYGQVGIDEGFQDFFAASHRTPQNITHRFPDGTLIVHISSGREHTLAISETHAVFSWGHNMNGQLGDGTTTDRAVPTDITTQFNGETIVAATSGESHSIALSESGKVFTFGTNAEGQLGDDSIASQSTSPIDITSRFGDDVSLVFIATQSQRTTFALGDDMTLYGFGRNADGQVGNNTTDPIDTPFDITVTTWQLVRRETYRYGDDIVYYDALTKAGHTFVGWYLDEDLTTPAAYVTMPDYDLVLYAKWVVDED